MDRPRSLIAFTALYLLYGLIQLGHGYLVREKLGLEDLRFFVGEWVFTVWLSVRLIIIGVLAWLIYFKRSKVGRVLIVIQIAPLVYRLPQAYEGIAIGNIKAVVWLIGFIAGALALACLFARDSRAYFANRFGSPSEAAATFE